MEFIISVEAERREGCTARWGWNTGCSCHRLVNQGREGEGRRWGWSCCRSSKWKGCCCCAWRGCWLIWCGRQRGCSGCYGGQFGSVGRMEERGLTRRVVGGMSCSRCGSRLCLGSSGRFALCVVWWAQGMGVMALRRQRGSQLCLRRCPLDGRSASLPELARRQVAWGQPWVWE